MTISQRPSFATYLLILICSVGFSDKLKAEPPSMKDVVYGNVGEHVLKLDFYEPTRMREQRPVVIWIHGGAWRAGSKADVPILTLRDQGFAIASVDYRLSTTAPFPAQIHDIKAAVRYLRANAKRLSIESERFVLAGSSAGGHLAVLAAVTEGVAELDGELNDPRNESSQVQAVVSFFGASNLQTILAQSTPFGINMRVPALELLLGGLPEQQPKLARLASPVEHIDPNDPPLWLFHGDQDPQMPINQSHELVGRYKRVGQRVSLDVLYGGKHGGGEFFAEERLSQLGRELWDHLSNSPKEIRGRVQGGNDRNGMEKRSRPKREDAEADEGKKAKVHQLSQAEVRSLPPIESFQVKPTDQFIVSWESLRSGHPYLGTSAAKPHTGAHLYFRYPETPVDPKKPETYPAIYAFADGIVTRVDEAFRLRPVFFPSLGISRANLRYGIDVTFAQASGQPVSFHYSIEPMIDPGDLDFYKPFLLVRPGDKVRKGDVLARMYLPPQPEDHENSHIHFNLIRERQFQAPTIFDRSVTEKFSACWDSQRLREDWPIPPCFGWKLDRLEDPFSK